MKRRGLSTVVGAVFFVLVMASSIGYVTYSLDLIDDLARQVDVKQDTNQNRQNEEFIISKVSVDGINNEFNLTMINTGNIPINITRMWAKNMTDPSWNQTKYQINKFISPGQSITNVGQGTGLVALDSESYLLKLVTSRGNTVDTQLLSATSQPLQMSLFTTPANPLSNQNVTILFTVKNNLTEGKIIQSLVPDFENPVDTTGSATATLQGSISPSSVEGLKPGELALFEATYEVTGDNTEQIIFNASIANAVLGNYVTDTSVIDIAPVAESAVQSTLAGSFGKIFLNFTTFEACLPSVDDCFSDNADWKSTYELTKSLKYLYRLNVTNNGDFDLYLEGRTALQTFANSWDGGSAKQDMYFIRDDCTTGDEDGDAYTQQSKVIDAGENEIMYFGSIKANDLDIKDQFSARGTMGVSLLIFANEDQNGNGYQSSDPEYSQNLPFLAIAIKD